MTEPLQILYRYAQEHMVLPLLRQEPDYERTSRCVEEQEEKFRAQLNKEVAQNLEKLLEEQVRLSFLQEQALFCAGFTLAVELMRV